MREILFRGKRIDNGEWVYGYFVDGNERKTIQSSIFTYQTDTQNYIISDVVRKTIGQLTGLTDKNGTKIFEGDIVQYQIDMINLLTHEMYIDLATSKIEFYNGSFTIYENGYGNTLLSEKHKDIEVIGNIHERGND